MAGKMITRGTWALQSSISITATFTFPGEVFAVLFHFHGKKVTAEHKRVHILPLAFYAYFAEKKTCFGKLKTAPEKQN
jgi:hypothetical protein